MLLSKTSINKNIGCNLKRQIQVAKIERLTCKDFKTMILIVMTLLAEKKTN